MYLDYQILTSSRKRDESWQPRNLENLNPFQYLLLKVGYYCMEIVTAALNAL